MGTRLTITLLCIASLALNTIGIVSWNAGAPYDTAHKGIETIEEVLQGNWAPFYRHYNGQPPLMDWFLAPIFLVAGINAYTLHSLGIVSAVSTTLLLYLVGKKIWSPQAGIYASAFGTTSHWILLESREGTHNIPLVPMLLLIGWCLGIVAKNKKTMQVYGAAITAGTTAGLLGYVYASGWIFSLLMIVMFPILCIAPIWVKKFKHTQFPMLISTVLMLAILAPFMQFIWHSPSSVTGHADDEIRTRQSSTLLSRTLKNLVPTAGAFLYLPFGPLANWEPNGQSTVHAFTLTYPVPLVSPGVGALFALSVVIIGRGWIKGQRPMIATIILGLFLIALIPNLLTAGTQPHYRRAITAAAPLFLLVGWAAARIHAYMAATRTLNRLSWSVAIIATLLYGPWLYFFVVAPSTWFAENYQTKHDRIATYLFARVAAGQHVTLAGNTAHMKPFQFYALATPQAQKAFTLLNLHTEQMFPSEVIAKTDTLFYVSPTCQTVSLPGFSTPPQLLVGPLGIDACIYDRPNTDPNLLHARVPLPSSGSLLKAYRHKQPPLSPHTPFSGTIFGM